MSTTRIPFTVRDADGNLVAGLDLSAAGVVQVSVNGAAFANRAGVAPSEPGGSGNGGGAYYYDATELPASGFILVKIVLSGYRSDIIRWDTDGTVLAAVLTAVAAIPTNPALTSDSRFANLDAAVSTRAPTTATTAIAAAIGLLPVPPTAAAIAAAVFATTVDGIAFSVATLRMLRMAIGKRVGQTATSVVIQKLGSAAAGITITKDAAGDAWTAIAFDDT